MYLVTIRRALLYRKGIMNTGAFYLSFGALLSILVVGANGLRCYSCNGYYGSTGCKTTKDCNSYCYKKTADRVIGGQTTRVTLAGCRSSCSTLDKVNACYEEKNCAMSCCKTSYCNRVTSSDSLAPDFPKCYSCSSTTSYADCKARSIEKACGYTVNAPSYCYKATYITTNYLTGVKKRYYKKDCTTSARTCSNLRSVVCSGYTSSECEVHCCTGKKCNASNINRASLVAIVTLFVLIFASL